MDIRVILAPELGERLIPIIQCGNLFLGANEFSRKPGLLTGQLIVSFDHDCKIMAIYDRKDCLSTRSDV
jgi:hypothetical protein